MRIHLISLTTLASIAGAITAPTESNDLPRPAPLERREGWWRRAEITKPTQMVICWDKWLLTCMFPDFAKPSTLNTNIRGCWRMYDPAGEMSISPSVGLNCTLHFDDSCRYGQMVPNSNPLRPGKFPVVVENFVYPGRGNFDDQMWVDRGFSSPESKGKPPKSISCQIKGKGQVGLITGD